MKRSETPRTEPQTEAAAYAAHCTCSLVTSARFAKWSGCGREGDGDEQATRGAKQNRALVAAIDW